MTNPRETQRHAYKDNVRAYCQSPVVEYFAAFFYVCTPTMCLLYEAEVSQAAAAELLTPILAPSEDACPRGRAFTTQTDLWQRVSHTGKVRRSEISKILFFILLQVKFCVFLYR